MSGRCSLCEKEEAKKKEIEEGRPLLAYTRRNIEGYKNFISIDITRNITSNLLQLLFLQLVNHPTGNRRHEGKKKNKMMPMKEF